VEFSFTSPKIRITQPLLLSFIVHPETDRDVPRLPRFEPESGVTAAEGKAAASQIAHDPPTHVWGMKTTPEVAFIPKPSMIFPAAQDAVRGASLDPIHAGFRLNSLISMLFSWSL
jgi:hypothetical protein